MSMGNWDTYSINKHGKPVVPWFKTPDGIVADLYKNWIYVRDEIGWTPCTYAKPTVMEFWYGGLRYKELSMVAVRGPQNGIYCACWTGWEHDGTFDVMYGVGCYGYSGDAWVGVTQESKNFLKDFIKALKKDGHNIYEPIIVEG